jgi:addiction module HigA family antidote
MKILPNIHPREMLLAEFVVPMNLSQNALARAVALPPRRIIEIVLGKHSISADTAVRLAWVFGTSERSWLNLRTANDLKEARRAIGRHLAHLDRLAA